MSILIGHASIDENKKIGGGQAGDQTGKEVYICNWYAGDWNVVLRPVSADIAEKMAVACEVLCKGNLVGYDQYQRNTLWDELEKVGWNPAKLKTKCETDCSAFMSACTRAAGVNIPRVNMGNGQYNAPVTYTMCEAFNSTGKFQVLTDTKYMTSDKYLKRGDILVRESGHTAMALGNGAQSGTVTTAQPVNTSCSVSPPSTAKPANATTGNLKEIKAKGVAFLRDNALTGTYKCTALTFLSARDDSNAGSKELTRIMPGDTVDCYGYFNLVNGIKWLYVTFVQGDVRYTTFACASWLKKLD